MKGFTLIELVVVIATLAILAAGAFIYIDPLTQLQKAEDAKRKNDLSQIQIALEEFYKDNNGKYPSNAGIHDYRILGLDGNVVHWGSSWLPFASILPADPKSTKKYVYVSGTNGQSYRLYASLERGASDPQACNTDGKACSGVPLGVSCGTMADICNYGVSSPNVSP